MSEHSLSNLIDSLKSEAIEAADREAEEILEKARARAATIISDAELKSKERLAAAEQEAKDIIHNGKNALAQAARDVELGVQHDLRKLLSALLEKEVKSEFTPDLIKNATLRVIGNVGSMVTLVVPPEMEEELTDYLQAQLQEDETLPTITQDENLLHGLTVEKTGHGWSYQITPEEISALLSEQLSSKWAELIKIEH